MYGLDVVTHCKSTFDWYKKNILYQRRFITLRLWHKSLIDVLPRQQLVAQLRECMCIARNIYEHGTPNHILVNVITEYPESHFGSYIDLVIEEMLKRGYTVTNKTAYKFQVYLHYKDYRMHPEPFYQIFKDWHDDEYLLICYYNLLEKFLRGGIPIEEWESVQHKVNELIRRKDKK